MVQTTGMSSSGILICQSVVPAEAVALTDPEAVLGKRPISLPAYALSTLCRQQPPPFVQHWLAPVQCNGVQCSVEQCSEDQ